MRNCCSAVGCGAEGLVAAERCAAILWLNFVSASGPIAALSVGAGRGGGDEHGSGTHFVVGTGGGSMVGAVTAACASVVGATEETWRCLYLDFLPFASGSMTWSVLEMLGDW